MTADVRIYAVAESQTRGNAKKPYGYTRFEVRATRIDGPGLHRYMTFATFDAFKASLCKRAKELGRIARITYEPSRFFDDDLKRVELLTTEDVCHT